MTAVKEKSTRQEKGEELYAAGAVEVVEEWTRKSEAPPYAPVVAGGRYEVEGSRGLYEVTAEVPQLGAPTVTCLCEDYRRAPAENHRCKHGFAVLAHIRAANRNREARLQAVRAKKARQQAAEKVPA